MNRLQDSDVDSLLWSLLVLAIGGAVMLTWNSQLPAPILWVGYVGMIVGAGLLLRWWLGVVR